MWEPPPYGEAWDVEEEMEELRIKER